MENIGNKSIVVAKDLSKIYGSSNSRVVALDSVGIEISKGEIVAIFGPSGSGKTTLLNLLAGLDVPTSGQVFIDNQEITKMTEEEKTRFRARNMGFIFQFFNLIPVLNAVENVELPLLLNEVPLSEARKRSLELLEKVNMASRKDAYPSQLSGENNKELR